MSQSSEQFIHPEEILKQVGIRLGMKAADLGCGSGYLTVPLAKAVGKNGKVYGVDVQKAVLEHLKQTARFENLDNIETMWSDLEIVGATGIEQKSLDLVILANVLFQAKNKQAVIKEAKRLLKDGGMIIVIDWKSGDSFGPTESQRVNPEFIEKLVLGEGFSEKKDIDAGKYHFGFMFLNH